MKNRYNTLSDNRIRVFVKNIACTRDHDLVCGECLRNVGEFAEDRFDNPALKVCLELVQHHIDTCADCREEFLALMMILNEDCW